MMFKTTAFAHAICIAVTSLVSEQRPSVRARDPQAWRLVEFVGAPRWWIEPLEQDHATEGHLYFEVIVKNLSTHELTVGVSFRAYLADGTPYPGCSQIGGVGADANIRPGEKAALFCSGTIAPVSLKDLQITSRLEYARATDAAGMPTIRPSDVTL